MSQVNTNAIYDASGGQSAKLYGPSMRYGGTAFVNRIINGDMRIDQRNAGAAVTINDISAYTLDRWYSDDLSGGSWTIQQSSVAPAGFTNSLLVTITAADSSLSATERCRLIQFVEGFNMSDLAWGTASASPATLSFWVRSSVTGTLSGSLLNSAENRSYPFTYTVNAANTWEQKTVTIPGETSGTWVTNNGIGIRVIWSLGMGSNFNGTAGAWNSSTNFAATGAVNLIGTNGATFYITGVQLEAGSVASPFERRDYGRELIMCQRYFYKTYNQGVAPGTAGAANGAVGRFLDGTQAYASLYCSFPVSMRATPTVILYAPTNGQAGVIQSDGPAYRAALINTVGEQGAWAYVNNVSLGAAVGTQAHFVASIEL